MRCSVVFRARARARTRAPNADVEQFAAREPTVLSCARSGDVLRNRERDGIPPHKKRKRHIRDGVAHSRRKDLGRIINRGEGWAPRSCYQLFGNSGFVAFASLSSTYILYIGPTRKNLSLLIPVFPLAHYPNGDVRANPKPASFASPSSSC